MSKKYISWDPAYKTLAWSYVTIDTETYKRVQRQLDSEPQESLTAAAQFIEFHSCGVADVLNGARIKDVDEISRTRALYNWLEASPVRRAALPPDVCVVIEHQPSKIGAAANNKSTIVSHQLALYYIDFAPVFVAPNLKDKISFTPEYKYDKYTHSITQARLAGLITPSKYKVARRGVTKVHAKDNFHFLLRTLSLTHVTGVTRVSQHGHIADTIMQLLAYICR